MLALLDDYLSSATTPELKALIVGANDVFDRLGYELPDGRYEEIIMMADVMELGEPISQMLSFTKSQVEGLLKHHNVTVADDVDLAIMTKIMDGILDLTQYENVQELFDTIGAGDSPEETFAELIALVTDLSIEEVLVAVEEVNPYLFNQLKETIGQPALESEPVDQTDYVEKLTAYCTFRLNPQLEILEYISQGLSLGYDFVTYADLIGRNFEEMPVEKIVDELIAMAIISSDGHNNPRSVISANLEHYIADPNKVTKVDVMVSDFLLRFDA